MKLINKTQRIYLVFLVGLLFLWSIIFLFAISRAIEENIDETLRSELLAIVNEAKNEDSLRAVSTQQMDIASIYEVKDTSMSFSDTTLFNAFEKESFPYRQITTQANIQGEAYKIILRRSMVEYDDLFEAILVMELIFMVLLIAGLFLINKNILERLWNPFYETLHQVTHYRIGRSKELEWKETNIDEFMQLNEVLQLMIGQIEREYKSLKQFTENASHEIQTPLSVISNKIEVLLQDESLTQQQGEHLHTIQQTAGKLSRLNRALLMLTRIENNQFAAYKKINISDLLRDLISDYRTLAQSKKITLYENIKADVRLNIHAELAELMFRNLLANAIKHNAGGGYIKLSLDSTHFKIKNTGHVPIKNPQNYIKRFQKEEGATDSLGLGLSIVLAIAEANNLNLSYSVKKDIHTVEIIF